MATRRRLRSQPILPSRLTATSSSPAALPSMLSILLQLAACSALSATSSWHQETPTPQSLCRRFSRNNSCTGLVTVNSGATFEVAESGMTTLNGDLSLADGAALGFNFTEQCTVPVLALASGKSVIFAEGESTNIVVKVSGLRPRVGERLLTTCGGFDAEGVTVSHAEGAPKWVSGVSVNGDGNIAPSRGQRPRHASGPGLPGWQC